MRSENLTEESIYELFKRELNLVGYGYAQTLYKAVEASGFSAAEIKADYKLYNGLYTAATEILRDYGFSKDTSYVFDLSFNTALKNEEGFY